MFQVMMVCTGNICRSPMAAGLLAHYLPVDLKEEIEVSSTGTSALNGHSAHDHAIETMARLSVDIEHHRARQLTRNNARSADLILTMEAAHLPMVKRTLGWVQTKPRLLMEFDHESTASDIHDPYGEPLEAFMDCAQTLIPCIKGVIFWLANNV